MGNIKEQKDLCRKKHKFIRKNLAPDEKREKDARVCENIIKTNAFTYAEQILLYAALPLEIETIDIFNKAIEMGKKVYFPRCQERGKMTFHLVTNFNQLKSASFGIREPNSILPLYVEKNSDICIVPALAYDASGYRLGYGGGYYDRFISDFSGTTIGVCYAESVEKKLPRGRFDIQVDILMTDKGLYRIR